MGGGNGDLKMKEAAAMEGGDLNLKLQSVAIGECDREDLKMKEAAPMGPGDREDLKMKEAAAMDQGYRDLKTKDASGSEGGDVTLKRKPWEEEGAILNLRKEVSTAMDLWFRAQSPARMARKDAQEKAQKAALGAGKKKMKKVVKSKLPKELIEHMAVCPFTVCKDISDENLAQRTPYFREVYAAVKIYEAKYREYWNALKAQQDELGYAEDEIEVTDDEEAEAVVKN